MKATATAFLLALSCQLTFAQQGTSPVLKEAKAETVGMSTDRLQRLDRILQDYTSKNLAPGAIAYIVRDGKVVYNKAFGVDDVAAKTALQRDAIMRIASQTKAITSVGVMMLYEEGRFLLDDPISKYIPAFANPKVLATFNEKDSSYTTVPAKREVTIRQLLTHTSGIGYAVIGSKEIKAIYAKAHVPSGIGTSEGSLATAMNALGPLPLVHQPGEQFTYGLSVDVLGYLIEVLSGQSLDEYFRQRIFEPLGMKDTYFYLPAAKQARLATLYTEDATRQTIKMGMRDVMMPDHPKVKGSYFSGGAGLSSTIQDYAIFLQMMLNGGEYNGRRLLSPTTVHMMTINQIGEVEQGGGNKFGLGFSLTTAKTTGRLGESEGSFEWGGIFGTTYWVDPKEGIVALLYTQKYRNSSANIQDKFRTLVYQALTSSRVVR
ncbi:serine hydrolase domain-containing protein [Hymenobacter sp. GOD-10R]|uniref:serine hydrolase domain-containing protein n=1 Tax=Hymenobacter sp. GOD-10R TaxID=3093922 RepID=UPI002D78EA05|nr:serine hydrolase domain-containing protein [Hymenobacter sp. GOD-10R]WRQ26435.1 serine hydrolase domain-containing protein [Hymenobacter sp. GOD-10R]